MKYNTALNYKVKEIKEEKYGKIFYIDLTYESQMITQYGLTYDQGS